MDTNNDRNYIKIKKITLLVAVIVVAAGVLGWVLGKSDNQSNNNTNAPQSTTVTPSSQPTASNNTNGANVKSLISFTLPDGWEEATCPSAAGAAFILPNGAGDVNCDRNPSSPVKVSVDSANNKECNQLQNVQNVSKHVCISEFINGKKSLKAETVYNQDSSYGTETTINAYYIDTGKGVVKVEYVHPPSDNDYQSGFEQLAKSVQTT